MRLTRKASAEDAAPLTPTVIVVLLDGWSAEPAEGRPHGFGDGLFELFESRDEGVADLWKTHELYLRTEARRRRIEPRYELSDGRLGFFGEHCLSEVESMKRRRQTGERE